MYKTGFIENHDIETSFMIKHAYCIIAHNEPNILKVLIAQLDDPRNDIYILIDAKSNIEEFAGIYTNYSKVKFIDNRLNIFWGDFSQVRAELLILEEASKGGCYSYFHLLSGVDLCLRDQDYIHDFFSKNAGLEFIDVCTDDKNILDAEYKFRHYFLLIKQQNSTSLLIKMGARVICRAFVFLQKIFGISKKSEAFVRIAKGSNWASISGEFCEYMIKNKSLIEKEFKYVFAADEIFLPTLFVNSHFVDKRYIPEKNVPSNLRAINWTRGNPYVWRLEDCNDLLNSDCLWARKFSTKQDKRAIDYIAGELV